MIDSRFPARPEKVLVKLYPKDWAISSMFHNMLSNDRAKNESLPNNTNLYDYFNRTLGFKKVFFANSATEALIAWIRVKFDYKLRIAIPSFFCPHVAYTLYSEKHELVLYDIEEEEFFISEESLNFTLSQGVNLFIIPSFFGYRILPMKKIDIIRNKGINVIIDLAQAFPLEKIVQFHDKNTAFIFSFGKSKALSSTSGGAIVPPKECNALRLSHFHESRSSFLYKVLNELYYSLKKKNLETSLKCLLNKKFINASQEPLIPFRLREDIATEINSNYLKYITYQNFFLKRFEVLKGIFLESKKEKYITFSLGIKGKPTILALNIKDEPRYNFSSKLAFYGIETTWYYYPLHLLEIYKNIAKGNYANTESIARNILVIPFSLHQSNQDFSKLSNALKEIL